MIPNPQYNNEINQTFEFERSDETEIVFRLLVKYHDETGKEQKSSLGDGILKLEDFVSWSGSSSDFPIPLMLEEDNGEKFESAVLNTQIKWDPVEPAEEYEPPDFEF